MNGKCHNMIIEVPSASSEELMRYWERLTEGVTELNAEWFADNPGAQAGDMPVYEAPRTEQGIADQRVATAPVVIKRGKATCVEWAAFLCGLERAQGNPDCYVKFIPVRGKYGEKPYSYHAVLYSNGVISDPTEELAGYPSVGGPWWARAGHCCAECALGLESPDGEAVKDQPCLPCEQGHDHHHDHG